MLPSHLIDAYLAIKSSERADNLRVTKKRGYSREFTPKTDRRLTLMADKVPATLYDKVQAKIRREGTSVRTVILSLLDKWCHEN